MEFEKYKKIKIAELRKVNIDDLLEFVLIKKITILFNKDTEVTVSISDTDLENGSPILGDMIARNPKNHNDQWLVAKQYFEDNFEKI
jgi:hypothetical protein